MLTWIAVGLIAIGVAWFAVFNLLHRRAVARAKAAAGWPWVEGEVVGAYVTDRESRDDDGRIVRSYCPVVRYSYAVGGRAYESDRLRFGPKPWSDDRIRASEWLKPYPVGSRTRVRYDPEDPAESVLEITKPLVTYIVASLLGLVLAAIGVWALMQSA